MHKIEMKINGKTHHCLMPSTWQEVSWKEWKEIAHSLFKGVLFTREVVYALLKKEGLLGANKLKPEIFNQIPPEGMQSLYDALNWLHLENCVYPPFEFIRLGLKKFYLPTERFEHISIVEWALMDMAWELNRFYESKNNPEKADYWLTRLCAYMCRPIDNRIDANDPETFMGDRREKLNTAIIDRRIPLFEKMDGRYRFGCIFYFLGCKRHIHKLYKGSLWHDTHDADGNEIIGVVSSQKPQPMRWMNIIRKLAGGKFGNLRETQFANLYDVLNELKDQVKVKK